MADLDFILILVIGGLISAGIGIGLARLSSKLRSRAEKKRALDFLEGRAKNEIVMDDERINIDKFQFKTLDGEIVKIQVGTPPENVAQDA